MENKNGFDTIGCYGAWSPLPTWSMNRVLKEDIEDSHKSYLDFFKRDVTFHSTALRPISSRLAEPPSPTA